MAGTLSSIILWQMPQSDGRLSVREQHTDSSGNIWTFDYIAVNETEINSSVSAHRDDILNGYI